MNERGAILGKTSVIGAELLESALARTRTHEACVRHTRLHP